MPGIASSAGADGRLERVNTVLNLNFRWRLLPQNILRLTMSNSWRAGRSIFARFCATGNIQNFNMFHNATVLCITPLENCFAYILFLPGRFLPWEGWNASKDVYYEADKGTSSRSDGINTRPMRLGICLAVSRARNSIAKSVIWLPILARVSYNGSLNQKLDVSFKS